MTRCTLGQREWSCLLNTSNAYPKSNIEVSLVRRTKVIGHVRATIRCLDLDLNVCLPFEECLDRQQSIIGCNGRCGIANICKVQATGKLDRRPEAATNGTRQDGAGFGKGLDGTSDKFIITYIFGTNAWTTRTWTDGLVQAKSRFPKPCSTDELWAILFQFFDLLLQHREELGIRGRAEMGWWRQFKLAFFRRWPWRRCGFAFGHCSRERTGCQPLMTESSGLAAGRC